MVALKDDDHLVSHSSFLVKAPPVGLHFILLQRSVANRADQARFRAQIWWGRWESNPHELPRPLLRRLRLPFRHFPAELRLIRVEQPPCLGGVARRVGAEPQFYGSARKNECDDLGAASRAKIHASDISMPPAQYE